MEPRMPSFPRVRRSVLALAVAILGIEVGVTVAYLLVSEWSVVQARYVVYPWIWINTGLFAVWAVRRPGGSRRHQVLAVAAATGYLLVLLVVAGIVSFPEHAHFHVEVVSLPPAWGPVVIVATPFVTAVLFPYEVIGYVALAYLVYTVVVEVSHAVVGAAVGVLSCVSCSLPIAAALVGGSVGTTGGLAVAAGSYATDLSTLAYLVTVIALLTGAVRTGSLE